MALFIPYKPIELVVEEYDKSRESREGLRRNLDVSI